MHFLHYSSASHSATEFVLFTHPLRLMKTLIAFRVSVLFLEVLGNLAFPFVTTAATSRLGVEVDGLKNRKGQVCLSVFAKSQGFPNRGDSAIQNRCVKITGTTVRVNFTNLQPGSYAVAVLHDTNSDGKANSNFLGIPSEGFGFSRNPKISTGPPNFADSAVFVAGPNTEIQIQLNYF